MTSKKSSSLDVPAPLDKTGYDLSLLNDFLLLADFHRAAFLALNRWNPSINPSLNILDDLISSKKFFEDDKDAGAFISTQLEKDNAVLIEDWKNDRLYLVEKEEPQNGFTALCFDEKGARRTTLDSADIPSNKETIVSYFPKTVLNSPTP